MNGKDMDERDVEKRRGRKRVREGTMKEEKSRWWENAGGEEGGREWEKGT